MQIYRGRFYTLGSFTSECDAARAYDRAARYLLGDAANLNFPNEDLAPTPPEVVRAEAWRQYKAERKPSMYSGVVWVEQFQKWAARGWRAGGRNGGLPRLLRRRRRGGARA